MVNDASFTVDTTGRFSRCSTPCEGFLVLVYRCRHWVSLTAQSRRRHRRSWNVWEYGVDLCLSTQSDTCLETNIKYYVAVWRDMGDGEFVDPGSAPRRKLGRYSDANREADVPGELFRLKGPDAYAHDSIGIASMQMYKRQTFVGILLGEFVFCCLGIKECLWSKISTVNGRFNRCASHVA